MRLLVILAALLLAAPVHAQSVKAEPIQPEPVQPEPIQAEVAGERPLPHLVVDLTNDRVLDAQGAFDPWHPASLTKMMTAYTVLRAVEQGRFDADTPIMMTWWASQQSPSKMGYRPGTLIPLKDALAMLMVKSANDVAMAIAETVGGSTEGFAAMMNEEARQLGMTSSYFVNPHGLHHPRQVTTARDMALLVRALDRYPKWAWLYSAPAIREASAKEGGLNLRKPRTYASFNKLLGRFSGADGMKTGFVCASGFNLAGTATRDGRRLLAIVFGRNNGTDRAVEAARLLQLGFEGIARGGAKGATLAELKPDGAVPSDPRNMRDAICETQNPPRVEPLQALPDGVQGPPGPPRVWLDPPPAGVTPLTVRTAGYASPWPDYAAFQTLPVPSARPADPPIDGEPVARSDGMTVPVPRPGGETEQAAAPATTVPPAAVPANAVPAAAARQ